MCIDASLMLQDISCTNDKKETHHKSQEGNPPRITQTVVTAGIETSEMWPRSFQK
jgi:hypothetical protein